jgi:Concanavalin A-like lectin/glucanases superfamily/Abnormal spindle-like microcephaly-assoc'd, ASPM-SPD-2-Hydin
MPSQKNHVFRSSVLALSFMVTLSTHAALLQAQTPLGQWTFDSSSGTTAADSSGNGYTASLINGVTWVTGKIGNAVSASAARKQYIKLPTIDLTGTKAVTVTFWSNRSYSTNGGHVLLENTENYNNSTTGFGFFPDDADCHGIQAAVHGNAGYTAVCYNQPTSNVWHHFAVVYDKSKSGISEVTLYIDGVLQTPFRILSAVNNTNNFGKSNTYLFARGGTNQYDSGELDNLTLYNTALTATQVHQIYQSDSGSSSGSCQLTAAPSSISFQTSVQGTTSSYAASLVNKCSTSINVSSAKSSGSPFSFTSLTAPFSIAPGQAQSYTVLYSPAMVGTSTGSLTFNSNAASTPVVTVSLSGTSTAPQQGVLSSSPASLNMGNVSINNSQSQAIAIKNTGTAAVTVSAINITGIGFAHSNLSAPFTLSAGQSVSLTVTFTPASVQSVTGSLTLSSSAQNKTLVVPLSGVGVGHSVALTWVGSGSQVAGYNVYRSTVSGGSYVKLNNAAITVTNDMDSAVVSGITYYYVITAVSTGGLESGYSNQAVATVP